MKKRKKRLGSYKKGGPTDPVEPVYVFNPNDPRLLSYQDSLTLYNLSTEMNNAAIKYKDVKSTTPEEAMKSHPFFSKYTTDEWEQKYDKPYNNLTKLNRVAPEPISSKTTVDASGFLGGKYTPHIYKKPVQPVIYDPPATNKISMRGYEIPEVNKSIAKSTDKFQPKGSQVYVPPVFRKDEGIVYNWNGSTYLPGQSAKEHGTTKGMLEANSLEDLAKYTQQFKGKETTEYAQGGLINMGIQASNTLGGIGQSVYDNPDEKFNKYLGMGLTALGGALQFPKMLNMMKHLNDKPEDVDSMENMKTLNPYGLKYGGSVPKNLRAMYGGRLDKLGNGVFLAKGKPHSKGGIKGDTDGDNKAEIEFEGGEIFLDNESYMINKDVSNKYLKGIKKLANRKDKISKASLSLLKHSMIKDNEELRRSKIPQLPQKKFFEGGPTSPYDFANVFAGEGYIDYGKILNLGNQVALAQNTRDPLARGVGDKRGGHMGTLLTPEDTSARTINTATPNTTLPMTTGDKLNIAGQFIAPLYNTVRGLMPYEKVKPEYNPYEGRILNTLSNMNYNPQAIQNKLTGVFNAGKSSISNMTGSSSIRTANLQNLYANLGQKRGEIDLQGQDMNNRLKLAKTDVLNSLGSQKVQARNLAKAMTDANKATKDQYLSTAASQIGQAVTTMGVGMNTNVTNNILYNTLQESFPGFEFNDQVVTNAIKGVKPTGMSDDQFIVMKQLLTALSK